MDAGGDFTALRMKTPQKELDRRKKRDERLSALANAEGMGLTKRTGQSRRSKGFQAFDEEGFDKLLLAVAGDQNFAALHNSITSLQKIGQISAEDAEKYKMQISKEQVAGTAPTVNQIQNFTNHTGNTSMVMSSKAGNPEYVTLQNY